MPGWALPPGQSQGHAKFVQANGTTSCATANCHGIGLVPKPKVTQGPECTSCHASFPHPAGWKAGTRHGLVALADIDGCKQCHGTALDQAPQGFQSCEDCHTSFASHDSAKPSVFGWGLKGHGAYVLAPIIDKTKKLTECRLCHGPSYTGGLSNTSCKSSSCHAAYPHPTAWKSGASHGITAVTQIDQCKMCHGAQLTEAPTGSQSCDDCHVSYLQHKTAKIAGIGWGGSGHGTWFLTPPTATEKAKKFTECQSCHAATYVKGIANKQGCKSCHAAYPHTDPQWAAEKHGTEVRAAVGNTTFAKAQTACGKCHGNTLAGGAVGIACGQCHATYPHATTGWASAWQTVNVATAHGNVALMQKATPPPQMPCTSCHGDPVEFSAADTKESLKVQKASPFAPTCYACHWAYPHPAWGPMYKTDDNGQPCGSAMNFEHTIYLGSSSLVMDAAGQHPDPAAADPLWPSAIHNTCGGSTDGSCHSNGNRSFDLGAPNNLQCTTACHGPGLPKPPKYPKCPPPPPKPPCDPDTDPTCPKPEPCDPVEEEC